MKTVIVTGCSRGLGLTTTKVLLKSGLGVIGISRSKNEDVKDVSGRFEDKFKHIKFDLSDVGEIKKIYLEKIKQMGPISGLVNNAAFAYDDIITNADQERLKYMASVNIISPVLLSKFVIRDMLLHDNKWALVHVSSVSTSTGYTGLSMYAASKGALESLSKGIAREWGRKGIRSNCIAPGFMETSMTSDLSEQQRSQIYNRTSLKEPTNQKSVAETIKFLLSDRASSITGETIRVDSGTL